MPARERFLISYDGAQFYVRHVASTVEDRIDGTFSYRCDKHEGGPFDTIEEAATCMRDAAARAGEDTGYEVTVGRVQGLTPNVQSIPREKLTPEQERAVEAAVARAWNPTVFERSEGRTRRVVSTIDDETIVEPFDDGLGDGDPAVPETWGVRDQED